MMKKLGGGDNRASANRAGAPAACVHERSSHAYKSTTLFAPRFTFALRMTTASSRNFGKFYRTVKLSEKNLCLLTDDMNSRWLMQACTLL